MCAFGSGHKAGAGQQADGVGSRRSGARVTERKAQTRRLMFGSLFGIVLRLLGVVLAFASQVVVARSLGAEAFGVYVTVVSWALVLSLLGGFGVPLCAVRFLSVYAEQKQWPAYRAFLRHAALLTAVSSGVIGGLMVLVFAVVPTLRPILAATLAGVSLIPLLSASALASAVFLAAQMPLRSDGLTNLTRPTLVVVLVAGALLLGGEVGVELALVLTVAAGLAALLLQLVVLWRVVAPNWQGPVCTGDRKLWISSGLAVLFTTVMAALIVKLDTIVLGIMISPTVTGPYDVAARLAITIGIASSAVNALVSPMCAQMLARDDIEGMQRILTQSTLLLFLLSGVAACGLLVLADPMLSLFGSSFVEARDALVILVAGQVAATVFGPAGGILVIAGHNRPLVVTMFCAVAVELLLLVILIPLHGRTGAALATMTTLCLSAAVLAVVVRRLLHVDTTLLSGLLWLARVGAGVWRRRDRT